jgi:hypothetical protein
MKLILSELLILIFLNGNKYLSMFIDNTSVNIQLTN